MADLGFLKGGFSSAEECNEAYGIRGNLLPWLSNFLLNHLQRVAIDGCLLDWTNVQSDVPQGSVLGPLLFIHDIPDVIEGGVRMFADNTKIYSVIRNFDDCLRLYYELSQWSTVWLLRFNAAKCILSNANQLFSCNVIPHDQ